MESLGFDEFYLAGHDRGSYTAFRAALDHPERVLKLVILDGVPILDAVERCDALFATKWWHWFFYSQRDKPEQAILPDPKAWYGGNAESIGLENYEDFQAVIHDPKLGSGCSVIIEPASNWTTCMTGKTAKLVVNFDACFMLSGL